jgi:hypothetical protein
MMHQHRHQALACEADRFADVLRRTPTSQVCSSIRVTVS